MIANLIISAVVAASVSTPEVVYNVESEGKKVTNIEMYSVTDGKYLNRLCKIDFSYDEDGDVIDKKTYEEFYKLKYCSTVVYMVPRA